MEEDSSVPYLRKRAGALAACEQCYRDPRTGSEEEERSSTGSGGCPVLLG